MILVEIALQNAASFAPKIRVGLKPGLNVIRLDRPELRAHLVDAIYFPLFPDPSRSTATEHLVGTASAPARAALSMFGRDKKAYRIMRDLSSGATRLYRFEAESKKYALLTEVTTEAAQFVRVQQQLPDEVSYERLFVYSPDAQPSLGSRARSRSGTPIVADAGTGGTGSFPSLTGSFSADLAGGASGSGWGAPPAAIAQAGTFGSSLNLTNALVQSELEAGPPEAAEVREEDLGRELKQLKRHLEHARGAEAAQHELDRLQRQRADLVQRAEVLVHARAQAEELEASLAELKPEMEGVSPKLEERLASYDAAKARYQSDLARLTQEREVLGQFSDTMDAQALERDPYFLGGLAFALLALIAAFALDMGWIALLNLAGAAVAGGAAFRFVQELEGSQRLEGRLKQADERRARIDKQYELETGMVRHAMEKLGVEDHRELSRRIGIYLDVQRRAAEAAQAVQRAEADPSISTAAKDLGAIEAEIAKLEPKVLGSAGSLQSADQMQRRMAAIERELAALAAASAAETAGSTVPVVEGTADVAAPRPLVADDDDSDDGYALGYGGLGSADGDGGQKARGEPASEGLWAASGMGSGPGGFGGVSHYGLGGPDGGGHPPDRSRDLVEAAADLVQMDVEGLVGAMTDRLRQYLVALSDGRLADGRFGPRGELSVVANEGQIRAYVQLSGEGLDLVDLALRLSLVEVVTAKAKIPIVVNDVAEGFPERRRQLFVQMLEHLGRQTQVVVLTGRDDVGGHVAEIESVG